MWSGSPMRPSGVESAIRFSKAFSASGVAIAAHVQGQELFVDGGATASPSGAPIYRG